MISKHTPSLPRCFLPAFVMNSRNENKLDSRAGRRTEKTFFLFLFPPLKPLFEDRCQISLVCSSNNCLYRESYKLSPSPTATSDTMCVSFIVCSHSITWVFVDACDGWTTSLGGALSLYLHSNRKFTAK